MVFWAYLIRCADGRYYTGQTDDLDRRFAGHNAGGFCDYTARRRPLELVWSESFQTRLEALEAERIVGGWSRAKKEALIAGNWSMVSHFAKPPGERFSISLETNGEWKGELRTTPFVSSEVEKRSPAR
jgi:putative endonuclease